MKCGVPSNSDSERSVFPISSLYYRHLTAHVASWTVQYLMRVTMIRGSMRMRRAVM
jgi:hypothetical protein